MTTLVEDVVIVGSAGISAASAPSAGVFQMFGAVIPEQVKPARAFGETAAIRALRTLRCIGPTTGARTKAAP